MAGQEKYANCVLVFPSPGNVLKNAIELKLLLHICVRSHWSPRCRAAFVQKGPLKAFLPPRLLFASIGVAVILYECRLGCLKNEIPKETQDYISALHLMFSSFKTTMYAGAIPKWLRPIIPKPWEEFCHSWDGLFKFSKCFTTSSFDL